MKRKCFRDDDYLRPRHRVQRQATIRTELARSFVRFHLLREIAFSVNELVACTDRLGGRLAAVHETRGAGDKHAITG